LGISSCGGGTEGNGDEPDTQPDVQEVFDVAEISYVDNLLDKIDTGEWILEEGLVESLKLTAGETDAASVLRKSTTINAEATGIVAMAFEYLEEGSDDNVKAEITRLLDLLVFSDEQLQAMAGISNTNANSGNLSARDVTPNPITDCNNFFLDYKIPPGAIGKCLEYKSSQKLKDQFGKPFVIYYPASTYPDTGWAQSHYDNAFEAMEKAVPIYDTYFKTLGITPPALSIYFSTSFSSNNLAFAAPDVARPCGIALHTNMRTLSDLDFKQVVAHEIGHCIQTEMFTAQQIKYKHRKWREEGYAEYLSNVVYPDNNLEWRDWLPALQYLELAKPLMDRSYMNFIFFQYLQNRIGDDGIITMIKSMPTDGDKEKQEETLANYSDMENIFHDFAQALTDKKITDTSNAKIPYQIIESNRPTVKLKDLDIIDEDFVRPFSVSRYRLMLDEDERADLNFSSEGTIKKSSRPVDDTVWVDVPEELPDDNCKPEIIMVVTSIKGKSSFELEIPKVEKEAKSCDIVGEWIVDNDSLWFEPSAHELDRIHGEIRITFHEDGRAAVVYDNHGYHVFADRTLSVGGIEIQRHEEFTHTTNAQGETSYEVDGKRIEFGSFFESSFLEGTETVHHIRQFNPANTIGADIDDTKERDATGWGLFGGFPRFEFESNDTINFLSGDGEVEAVLNRVGSADN